MVHLPESKFSKNLKAQTEQLNENLSTLSEIIKLSSDPSLTEAELLKQAAPMIEQLAKDHPNVAKDIKEVLVSGSSTQIKAFFDQEVQKRHHL